MCSLCCDLHHQRSAAISDVLQMAIRKTVSSEENALTVGITYDTKHKSVLVLLVKMSYSCERNEVCHMF